MSIEATRSCNHSIIISSLNSSTTPLNSGGTFTGVGEINEYEDVLIVVKTDQAGTLTASFSIDNVNWDSLLTFNVSANITDIHNLVKGKRYFRISFTNTSASNQTYFRLQTEYGAFDPLNSPLNGMVQQDADAAVVKNINEELPISQGLFAGYSLENKFGRVTGVGAATDVWDGGPSVYTGFPVSTLETVNIFSSNANDTAAGTGLRTIRIFGLDGNYNQQQEDITLNGLTAVTSTKTYRRIFRVYGLTAGSGGVNAGTITVRHTTTVANVFTVMPIGFNQSQISGFTIPAGYTGYLRKYDAEMNDNTANNGILAIWSRENGACSRIQRPFAVSTQYPFTKSIYGGLSYPEKTDIIIRVLSVQNANADISVTWEMTLVKN